MGYVSQGGRVETAEERMISGERALIAHPRYLGAVFDKYGPKRYRVAAREKIEATS